MPYVFIMLTLKHVGVCVCVCGGGGGGEGAVTGVIVVRVCEPVFQNLPYSYTWPLEKWTHSYT